MLKENVPFILSLLLFLSYHKVLERHVVREVSVHCTEKFFYCFEQYYSSDLLNSTSMFYSCCECGIYFIFTVPQRYKATC
uniref:Secreted protein n=1 Tax=Rhipicephalus appendiculatus TaxID=34631 RepID=A0A131YBD1_RHIAP